MLITKFLNKTKWFKNGLINSNKLFQAYSSTISHSDEEDYFPQEVEDPLYETQFQEEFTKLYAIGYSEQDRLAGYATKEGTQQYSSRSNLSTL